MENQPIFSFWLLFDFFTDERKKKKETSRNFLSFFFQKKIQVKHLVI